MMLSITNPAKQFDASSTPSGAYELGELIQTGGDGAVYAAKDACSRADVAVKVSHWGLAHIGAEEARIMMEVAHDNVLNCLCIEQDAGRSFLVMELADGDFFDLIASRPGGLPARTALPHLQSIARALAHMHSLGWAHGDVKPENVLLRAATAKLADFGAAIALDEAGCALSGVHAASHAYAAPELLNGGARDGYDAAAADVWALGITAWVAFCGRLPWTAARTEDADYAAWLNGHYTVPASLPPAVARLLLAALNPEAAKRPSMAEVLQLLAAASQEQSVLRARRRHSAVIAAPLRSSYISHLQLPSARKARRRTSMSSVVML